MPCKSSCLSCGVNCVSLPYQNCTITISTCEYFTIGTERDAIHPTQVLCEGHPFRTGIDIPDSDRFVVATAADHQSVWCEGDRIDMTRMSFQSVEFVGRCDIIEMHFFVQSAACYLCATGTECDTNDGIFRTCKPPKVCTSVDVKQMNQVIPTCTC